MSVLTNSSSSAHQKASNDDMGPFSLNPLATPEVMEAMRKQSTNGDSGRSNASANANGGTKGPSSSLSSPPPPPSFSDENDTHCLVFVKSSFGTVHYADLLSRAQSWLIDTLGANYYLNTRLYFHAHFNSGSQCKAAYHRARTEGGSTTKPVGNYCSLSSCGKSRVNTSEKAVEAGIESNQLRRWVLAYKPQVIDQKGSIKNKSDHTDTLEELKSALVNSVEKRRKQSDTNHNNASNGNTTAVTASFPLPSPITRPLKLSGVTSSSASSSSSSSPGSASPSLPSSARSMIRPLRYSVKSKEGYSEHYPNKVNQDRAFICEGFNGEEHHYFFGVMDGHGEWGHHISSFVQEKYPKYLSCEKKLLKEGKIGAALVAAVKKMTDELSDTRSINSAFSGSTACAMLKIDNHMHVANIGDSRAIMGRLNPATSTIEGIALTTDHKPDHPAEKARIEGAGGRVCALTEGGIVRVWLKHVDEPGLAMSRSIGDEVSATVGVIATPEISTIPLTANDQFIVMASDGVWEFLSNQEVADIVWKHRDAIEDAVRELIDAAFHRWQQESPESVDDITAIVAFLK